MKVTNVFRKNLEAYRNGYTIISNIGSTRSSKTYSILQLLYIIALKNSVLISVVSENMPHLKRGAIRDFESILETEGYNGVTLVNKTDHVYTIGQSRIEFFSADNVSKLHGSQRDILFINECNFLDYEKVRQLFIRTSGVKFLDYNPSTRFWIEELKDRDGFIELHSTYKDNNFLSSEQIKEIESHKNNTQWWKTYGLGILPDQTGKVYEYSLLDGKDIASLKPIYGLDFGYNDPTALIEVRLDGSKAYLIERLYKSKLSSTEVFNIIKPIVGKSLVIADNAEPQIIADLKAKGINIKPCNKTKVSNEVQVMRSYELIVEGNNLINELNNYYFKKDVNGDYTNEPIDKYNHLLDAARYVILNSKNKGKYTIL